MNTNVKIIGYWWLPETPENRVSGTLSFSPGEPIILEVMGTLNKLDDHTSTSQRFTSPLIIHGISSQGKQITIDRCTQIGSTTNHAEISITRFTGSFFYIGVHFSNERQPKFWGLSIGFQNLDEWFSADSFTIENPSPDSEVVTYKRPVSINTTVADYHINFTVLGPNSSINRFTHVNLFQEARIGILSDTEKSIDEFLPVIRHVQNFLTLAISQPTFITSIEGETESAKNEDMELYYPVEIYYSANGWNPAPVKVHYFQMMFTLPDIEKRLEKILQAWISKAEVIKPVYDLYFSALYNPYVYQEFQFLSLAQAVETYHRQVYGGKYQSDDVFLGGLYKSLVEAIPNGIAADFRESLMKGRLKYANEYSLRKRLQLLGEYLSENLNIRFLNDKKLRDVFAGKVTDTRNYLTHYPDELKEKAKSGQELSELIQELRLVLQVCLLKELDFPFAKITEIFMKNAEYRDYFL